MLINNNRDNENLKKKWATGASTIDEDDADADSSEKAAYLWWKGW